MRHVSTKPDLRRPDDAHDEPLGQVEHAPPSRLPHSLVSAAIAQTTGRPLVWVVDDSPMQAAISKRVLERHHEVVVFDRAASMLERLSSGDRPDLVLLDWHMPDISGLDACRYIRQVVDGVELPIIIFTAGGDHEALLSGLAAGANDYMTKPCDAAEMDARVATLVRAKRLHARLAVTEAALRDEASFRERFLAILAHDLRQPLNVFAMGAETLAAQDTPQLVREKVKGHFDRAAARMERMIGELLDFSRSRPQGGGMPITLHDADLAVVVQDVLEEVRVAHPDRHLTVQISGSCTGSWDADRLSQVVSNLLENALAHSPVDSAVAIAVTAGPGRVEIIVENDGPPIPDPVLGRLFDPFRRGAARRGKAARGLGLGLYIVDQIARAHGGDVSVASADGKIRFRVMLPANIDAASF